MSPTSLKSFFSVLKCTGAFSISKHLIAGENWVCLSPVVLHMENPGAFHLEENPEQQETYDEVSQCNQTPAHPEK